MPRSDSGTAVELFGDWHQYKDAGPYQCLPRGNLPHDSPVGGAKAAQPVSSCEKFHSYLQLIVVALAASFTLD